MTAPAFSYDGYYVSGTREITLDSSGEGRTTPIGPAKQGEEWDIQRYTVTCTSGCNVTVYRNGVGAGQVDFTSKGSGDSSEWSPPMKLKSGENIVFAVTNGTASATFNVYAEGVGRLR